MAESTSSDRSKRQGDCFFLQPHIFGFVVHRWRSGAWSIFQRYKERIWRQTFYSSKTFVSSPKHLNNDILCQKRLELHIPRWKFELGLKVCLPRPCLPLFIFSFVCFTANPYHLLSSTPMKFQCYAAVRNLSPAHE